MTPLRRDNAQRRQHTAAPPQRKRSLEIVPERELLSHSTSPSLPYIRDGRPHSSREDCALRKTEGECLAGVPWKFFNGEETRESVKRG